jgi:hypothetical protein
MDSAVQGLIMDSDGIMSSFGRDRLSRGCDETAMKPVWYAD